MPISKSMIPVCIEVAESLEYRAQYTLAHSLECLRIGNYHESRGDMAMAIYYREIAFKHGMTATEYYKLAKTYRDKVRFAR